MIKKTINSFISLSILSLSFLIIFNTKQVHANPDPATAQNVYRFLNNQLGSAHFYVMGDTNKDIVVSKSAPGGAWDGAFKYETVAFKAFDFNSGCPAGTVPVYRFLNNQFTFML
ncbi:MAG: hypothetical protein Q9M91_00140 [Candidatus Dojkabacteria bacterium]|nr:hypothetical protein [Candidatus Dojkabacteria bacterium]MDQ7020241.1 hypothetical protein [Candidatus Dojkabacteria bacterium]